MRRTGPRPLPTPGLIAGVLALLAILGAARLALDPPTSAELLQANQALESPPARHTREVFFISVGALVVASVAHVARGVVSLGDRADLLLLVNIAVGPGPQLHELAHAAVALRYAEVVVEPGLLQSRVLIAWRDEVPVWGVVGVYLAPLVLGGLLLLLAAPYADVVVGLPFVLQVWIAVNFVLLIGLSVVDVLELRRALG